MRPSLDEYEAIREAVQRYVDACLIADHDLLRSALHPKWTMYGIDDGATDVAVTVDEFVGWVRDREPPEGYRAEITNVESAKHVAAATLVEENYYGIDYVIFFSLVRYDGRWTIVTKSYSQVSPTVPGL